MTRTVRILAAALLTGWLLAGCSGGGEPPPTVAALAPPPAPVQVSAAEVQALYRRIDPDHPGRGTTDYPGNTRADVPKSYAMVLLGELERHRHREASLWPELGAIAARWLVAHADDNRDGVVGWGVPIAWDAYGDGSVNPADTEYSISTAIVMDALLGWREASPSRASAVLPLLERAARPYLAAGVLTPAGLLPYSLRESDRRYDTFNSAAYLAGQLQRLSRLTPDPALQAQLAEAADKTVAALLANRQTSAETGAWYWHYSIQEPTANDLPHAAYIVQGLLDYAAHGGRLSAQVDLPKVLLHLHEFLPTAQERADKGLQVRAWPRLRADVLVPARSYDLGMALALACTRPELHDLRRPLLAAVAGYRNAQGAYQKYPVASSEPALVVAEYEAYLYRGLAACLRATAAPADLLDEAVAPRLSATAEARAAVERAITPAARPRELEVPFVRIGFEARVLHEPATGRSTVHLPDGGQLPLPAPGIPLALLGSEGPVALVARDLQADGLHVHPVEAGRLGPSLRVRHAPDRQPIFRAAAWHRGALYLAYYDNPSQANYVVRLVRREASFAVEGEPMRLESLEDPAGRTYEMIPRLDFVAHGDRLWLVGGSLWVEVTSGSGLRQGRLAGCSRTVEVVAEARGPVALCAGTTGQPPYLLVAQDGRSWPELDLRQGLPWNLRLESERPLVEQARERRRYAAMLRRDLERGQQGGWLEYGIGNEEGRIPWSQIYYLNGFLDVLLLARQDERIAAAFGDLLPDLRLRLDLELQWLDQHWRSGRFRTRAFTVDRSLALFSVQTSRLLLLMDRYRSELPQPLALRGHEDLRRAVRELRGHIEVLARNGEAPRWIAPGTAHLRWPKGSKFYFDGVAVPYNHQNEWAYSVLRTAAAGASPSTHAALDILRYFQRSTVPAGVAPVSGEWHYWWGRAFDGWTAGDGISVNKPAYPGDKSMAWISFRTIDMMAMVALAEHLPVPERERLLHSVGRLVYDGKLYPFASYELLRQQHTALPALPVALRYARVSAPWEMQSAAWAIARLAVQGSTR